MNASPPWTRWIAEHGPQLVLFARRWAADRATAEDLVQEAFVRFWPGRDDVQDPVAYLYQCVRRVAIDAARSQDARRRREASRQASRPDTAQFACQVEQDERRREIEQALADLPAEQTEVVTLKIWSELTFAQIAEVTGTSVSTVASRYRYALNRLRKSLYESHSV